MIGPPVELVVFDLGRVLIRICDGWSQACRCAGVPWPDRVSPFRRTPEVEDLFQALETGRIDLPAYCDAFAAQCDSLAPPQVRQVLEAWLLGPYPGAVDLVHELHELDVHTACLSNTNECHWAQMHAPEGPNALPLDRLTHRFASHLVGVAKPQAAIYEHLERKTGLRGPQIVFFDDLEENVAAARDRGWRAHRIDPALDDPIGQAREHLVRYHVLHDGERTGIR